MPYKLSVTFNTKDKEYHQDFPHIFNDERELARTIKAGLRTGKSIVTSTVLTIVYVQAETQG